jgi:hypothetical protein
VYDSKHSATISASHPEKKALTAEMNRHKEGKAFTECEREFQSTPLLTMNK